MAYETGHYWTLPSIEYITTVLSFLVYSYISLRFKENYQHICLQASPVCVHPSIQNLILVINYVRIIDLNISDVYILTSVRAGLHVKHYIFCNDWQSWRNASLFASRIDWHGILKIFCTYNLVLISTLYNLKSLQFLFIFCTKMWCSSVFNLLIICQKDQKWNVQIWWLSLFWVII